MTLLNPAMLPPDDEKQARQQRASVPGMAHFAHTGPKGAKCGDCVFWSVANAGRRGYRCMKYTELVGREYADDLPANTPACKYFDKRRKTYTIDRLGRKR